MRGVVVVLFLLGSACATKREALIGVGTGIGVAVVGAVMGVREGNLTDHEYTNAPSPWTKWGALVFGGAAIAVVSLANLGMLAASESNAEERARVTPPVPVGTVIRAEGSSCTGRLDRCADGLVCDAGLCLRRVSAPGATVPSWPSSTSDTARWTPPSR